MTNPKASLLMIILFIFFIGCSTAKKGINPSELVSPDEKALYNLMVKRCQAVNARDMRRLETIYAKNSEEIVWLRDDGIPTWKKYKITFYIEHLIKVSIVGQDAAVHFVLRGSTMYGNYFIKTVEVLYVKEGAQWKIESVGDRNE